MADMNDFIGGLEELADARKKLSKCRNGSYYDASYVCRGLEEEVDEAETALKQVLNDLIEEKVRSMLPEKEPKPVRWEYQVERNTSNIPLTDFLSDLSAAGWEAVQVFPHDSVETSERVLARRPLYEPEPAT